MRCLWKKYGAVLQTSTRPRWIHGDKTYPWKIPNWARSKCIRLRGLKNKPWSYAMGTSIVGVRTTDRMTGMCFFVNGGTAVTQAQPEYPDLCIVRPIVFIPNTPDRLYPGQPHSAIAFQSPSVHGKDTSKAREIHSGGGCGYSGRNSYEQQVISKEFTRISRSKPGFHEIERLPNIDPNVTTELWLEQLKLGSNRVRFETCWYKSVNITPA